MQIIIKAFLILVTVSGLLAQDMIPVYLEPSPQSPILTLIRFDDPVIQDSSAISDSSKAKIGWRVTRYNGNFRGFVSGDDITRSGEIKPGSSVYLRKTSESMVLTKITSGDIYIIIRKGEWVEIDFEKPVSVYFQDDRFYANVPSSPKKPLELPDAGSENIEGARILGEISDNEDLEDLIASLPDTESSNSGLDNLPEPVLQPYTTDEEFVAQSLEAPIIDEDTEIVSLEDIPDVLSQEPTTNELSNERTQAVVETEEDLPELDPIGGDDFDSEELSIKVPTIKPPTTLSRRFEGRLVHRPSNLLIRRPFDYRLETASGLFMAFVDTSALRIHKVHAYRDLLVILEGPLKTIEKSRKTVISARTLRLRP